MTVRIIQGECIAVMRTLDADSVDAVVTDPPYGIGFMGKAWDHADIMASAERRRGFKQPPHRNGNKREVPRYSPAEAAGAYDFSPTGMRAFHDWTREWAIEALRVLKPGGHLLSFASTRTYHRMTCGIEEAGFEIRDQIGWLFGSGFPKSRNLAGEWLGWGTALKPAWEPIVLARKPLAGTVAHNVELHGVGALNIDGCRVDYLDAADRSSATPQGRCTSKNTSTGGAAARPAAGEDHARVDFVRPPQVGRWPANVIHDGSDEVLAAFPDAPGQMADASLDADARKTQNVYGAMRRGRGGESSADSANEGAVGFQMRPGARRLDSDSAARFFYCAKASRAERNSGLIDPGPQLQAGALLSDVQKLPPKGNHHPTVKPVALMRYLVRLVTPPGGTVLEPFCGSGTTAVACVLEGFDCIGIEKDIEHGYVAIAEARVAAAVEERKNELAEAAAATAQKDLFHV